MKAGGKSQKRKIINSYNDLRKEAMHEIAIDMVRQTIAILMYSLRLSGEYTDDQLREMFDHFVSIINLGEVMGKPLTSDEVTGYIIKELGIDVNDINPKIGE